MITRQSADDIIKRHNIRITGKGSRVMLFAHGFGCDQKMWRFVVPAFEENFRVVLFDYVGAGRSQLESYNSEKYASLHGYAEDILEICNALDLQDVILVGHSVSSMIGLLAAVKERERFESLIMVGPSPCYINDGEYVGGFERKDIEGLLDTMDKNYVGWANFLAPAIVGNKDRPELGQELVDSFCETDPDVAREFAAVTFFSDSRNDLDKLKIPVLLLQCSSDIIAPLEVGNYLQRRLPKATLRVMEATGHCPHLSAPAETIRLMQEFLTDN